MSRALSAALLTELGLSVTRPGYLIELGYSSTLRLSTMGDISWGGHAWSAADAKVSGIGQDGSGANTGTLQLGNIDDAFGSLVLNEGASDIAVAIHACYAGATAFGDPVQIFEGVTNGAEIDSRKVTLQLVAQGNRTLYSPRVFVNKAAGFNFLQPAGTKIFANGETFVLSRR
jgi:hypothetical protein